MKFSFILYVLANIKYIITFGETNNDNYICDLDTPLVDNSGSCIISKFNESKNQIANKIVKTQFMNKINQIGIEGNWFMGFDISSNGDLIIQSVRYLQNAVIKERNFYAIKSNGREFFYNKNTNKFINQIIINSTSEYFKFESEFIKIKLVNDGENDYYLSTSILNYTTTEIIDLNKNEIFGTYQGLLFGQQNFSSIRYSIFELSHNPKTYVFGFIKEAGSSFYLSLQKFQFYKTDLRQQDSFKKLGNSNQDENFEVYKSKIISCIEISKYFLIQCFYLNTSKYLYIGLFNEENLNFVHSEKISETQITDVVNDNLYEGNFKCILLKNETFVISYILKNGDKNFSLFIQIKTLIYNTKNDSFGYEDFLVRYKEIQLNKDLVITRNKYYFFDIKKINDKKFWIFFWEKDSNKFYIIIMELYKLHETNLYIKTYSINLKLYGFTLYEYLKCLNYNNYLGLIYTSYYTSSGDTKYQYFSLLSYINSTDSELNNNLNNGLKLNLSEYINIDNIENNIFGVELIGIKILKLPKSNEIGIYFVSELNNQIIYDNDILPNNDLIKFIFDYEKLKEGNDIYTIELAGIVQEQNYSEANKFIIYNEYYGNEYFENYYKQHIYIGRTSFYNFTINTNINGNNDNSFISNCKLCYSGKCIKCKDNYRLILDQNICLKEFNEEGYYYDEDNFVYKKCHQFCKTCDKGPKYYDDLLEIEDTNCIECIEGYYKMENTNNCVNINNPPMYHYFNTTLNKFLKCSENCLTCNQSQVNSSYYGCTSCDEISILYPESTNCLNCFARNKYINPYFNECLDEIPEGYYLKDADNKLVDICYYTCKTCQTKGNETNHQCLNCNEENPFTFQHSTCLDKCFKKDLYADLDSKQCFITCLDNTNTNKTFGFNYECYEKCPNGTKIDEKRTGENICICEGLYYMEGKKTICINSNNCPEEYPLQKENSLECYRECIIIYKLECYPYCPENTFSIKIYDFELCLDIINETMSLDLLNLDEFSFIVQKNITFNNTQNNIAINCYEGITINIYPHSTDIYNIPSEYSNLTFINLDKCEDYIRRFYHLDKNEILYIISAEIKNPSTNRVTNEFIFNIYLKNGTELEYLSICNNKNSSFYVTSALTNLDLANFDEAQDLYDQGYNIYNLTSEFYTDGCSPAKIGSNDITLDDRKLIYPQNISFCPGECDFFEVMIETKRVRCACDSFYTEKYINISTSFIKVNASDNFFIYLLDNFNYKIFKCYHILLKLDFNNLLKNIGFIFGVIVFFINLICLFIFSCCSLSQLRLQIYKSLPDKKNLMETLSKNESNFKREENKKRKTTIQKKSGNSVNNNILSRNFSNRKTVKSRTNLMTAKQSSHSLVRKESAGLPLKTRSENIILKNVDSNKKNKNAEIDFNFLPYAEALNKDKRNFFTIFMSIFKLKIEFIALLFYPEEFTYKSYTISMYTLGFLFGFFMNSLLYTDDIVSEKYHNNGKLNFLTTIFLSLTSNFISWIIGCFSRQFFIYNESLLLLIKDVKRKSDFILTFMKLYLVIKIKSFCYFFLSFIFIITMTYYIVIFCAIYQESQNSLLINYFLSFIESIITSICITIVICVLRIIGLNYQNKYFYRTSVFLDQKL